METTKKKPPTTVTAENDFLQNSQSDGTGEHKTQAKYGRNGRIQNVGDMSGKHQQVGTQGLVDTIEEAGQARIALVKRKEQLATAGRTPDTESAETKHWLYQQMAVGLRPTLSQHKTNVLIRDA
ncbi:hypothetical protein O9992_28490 [Vibrio lentus]|nr:hypothetical protein [Vibrio lentus]